MKYLYKKDLIDNMTGELIESTTASIVKKGLNKKTFVKAFVDDISLLCKCSKAESAVIWCCLQYIDYRSNEIILNTSRRKQIAEKSNLTMSTVNQSICKLKKKNIFITEKDRLFFHPDLFMSCNEETASKIYELTLRYEIDKND